jgi:Na+-driven multidrug efflux pump
VVVEAFFWGMNAGIGVSLSGSFGARDYEEFKKIVVSNRIFIFAVTSTLALLAIILNGPILKFLNVEEVIYIDSRNYFILMFINMPFALITHLYIYIFSSMGMSSFPMYISMASSVINIVGNILSVTVLDIGVIGLGLSTVISTIISFLLYTIKIRKCYKEMEVDKLSCRFNFKYVKRVFPAAIPNGAQQLSMYLAGFIISPIKNGLGYTAIASLSIVGKVESMMSLFYGNCARTISTYIPQCVGAKKYHKIKKAIGVSFIQSLVFVIPVMLVIWLFPQIICSLFFNSETEAEVIQNVVTYIKIFMPFMYYLCLGLYYLCLGLTVNTERGHLYQDLYAVYVFPCLL